MATVSAPIFRGCPCYLLFMVFDRMFNQQELQILIGGVDTPIDLGDLRRNTNYGGLYHDDEPTIQAFWKVVNSFTQEQKRSLLRFATSCSRPPLLLVNLPYFE